MGVRGIMQGLLRVGGVVRVALVLGLLAVCSQALAQASDPAVVVITAGDDATSGAAVRINGEPSGNVPLRKTIAPGRHLVQVGKRGFVTYSKWVDLTAGQVLNIPVTLQLQAPKTGSLLITADVTGLPVLIDGQNRGGTPLVVDGLTEGEHVVEIKSPGEGYQPFLKTVVIKANERTTVDAIIRIAPDLGSLRVIASVPGAIISLDGADIGVAPAARAGLTPGEH
ncbi:MAG: PEGA domain-containing protein, partial [Polyangiales bacterium]